MSDDTTETTREHEWVIHSANDPENEIHLWWDGEKVVCSHRGYLEHLVRDIMRWGYTTPDSPEFLESLPKNFRNGYVMARRVKRDG